MSEERKFPLLGNGHKVGSIPWWVAEQAYMGYASKYGDSQSLERLAERGGFGIEEMDEFFPEWREKASLIEQLQSRLATEQETNRKAYGYAKRMFAFLAPQCEPFDDLELLLTQIDNWCAGKRWRSVGERLPEKADCYDVVFSEKSSGQAFWNGQRWRKTPTLRCTDNITHWKPIVLP